MEEKKNFCFVIMPTGKGFDEIYKYAVKEAVRKYDMECILVHNIPGQGNIIAEIIERIYNAKLVIADLTNNTSEILYELGLTHGLLNNVIMITQNYEDLPFDLKNYRVIQYSTDVGCDRELKEKINSSIEKLSEWIDKSNPVKTYLPKSKIPIAAEKYSEIKAKLDQAEDNFKRTENKLAQKAKELDDTKNEMAKTQKKLSSLLQAEEKLKKTGIELSNTIQEFNDVKQKFDAAKRTIDERSEALQDKNGEIKHYEQKNERYIQQAKEIQELQDKNDQLQEIRNFSEKFFRKILRDNVKNLTIDETKLLYEKNTDRDSKLDDNIVIKTIPIFDTENKYSSEIDCDALAEGIYKMVSKKFYDPMQADNIKQDPNLCFVFIPNSRKNRLVVFQKCILPTLEQNELKIELSPEIDDDEAYHEKIFNGIKRAQLVIADVTDQSPGGFYYIAGICNAIGRKLLIVSQNAVDASFTICMKHIMTIIYKDSFFGFQELSYELENTIQSAMGSLPLAAKLRTWYNGRKNYKVDGNIKRNGIYADLTVKIPDENKPSERRGLVRAFADIIRPLNVRELSDEVKNNQHLDKGIIVSSKGVHVDAYDEACNYQNIDVYTFHELIDSVADWSKYFEYLKKRFDEIGVAEDYVELSATIQNYSQKGNDPRTFDNIDKYIDEWIISTQKRQTFVLGEFGTGKTWFTLHYTSKILQRYEEAVEKGNPRPRIPILIHLSDYQMGIQRKKEISSLFLDFRKQKGIDILESDWTQLVKMGRLLFILDGFDEMNFKVNTEIIKSNFERLIKPMEMNPASKALITCRKEHFLDIDYEDKLLTGDIVEKSQKFNILYLERMNDQQLFRVLDSQINKENIKNGGSIKKEIISDPKLKELARRPLIAKLIIIAINQVESNELIDLAHIYLHAIQNKLKRDFDGVSVDDKKRSCTPPEKRELFLREMAWEMFKNGQKTFLHSDTKISELINIHLNENLAEGDKIDILLHDMLGQTLLVRDPMNKFKFAHRSILEFFVAHKLALEIDEVTTGSSPPPGSSGNMLSETPNKIENFDLFPLPTTVLEMMWSLVNDNGIYNKIIDDTKNFDEEKIHYAGGNALTTLRLKGERINKDLSHTNLSGANLFKSNLSNANFHKTILRETDFSGCKLINADFSEANLSGAKFAQMNQIYTMAWSHDGECLASGGADPFIILWNTADWSHEIIHHTQSSYTWGIKWSKCNRLIACSTSGEGVILIDYDKLKPNLNERFELNYLQDACEEIVNGIDIYGEENSSKWIAVGGDQCRIFNAESGKMIEDLRISRVFDIAFSPKGNIVAVAQEREGNHILLYSFDFQKNNITLLDERLSGHQSNVVRLKFSPDGKYMVSCTSRSGIGENARVWDMDKMILKNQLENSDTIQAIDISPDGKYIVGGCIGGQIGFWNAKNGNSPKLFEFHKEKIRAISISPDGKYMVSAGDGATICIYSLALGDDKVGEPKRINIKTEYEGMNLRGAKGLDKKTLKLFYKADNSGAKLDEKQLNKIGVKRDQFSNKH
ncbi:pentapeptide repeat-containing protein [Desulfobacterales bacterium HSG16]|nr:pentapeptide repeat-containing protein [Desulfobacterales bacterium HSG16]